MKNINGEDLTERQALTRIVHAYQDGNNKDACSMIYEYGIYDFWSDFRKMLSEKEEYDDHQKYILFSELTIIYHRIKG